MAEKLVALRAQLDAGHPVTGAYDPDDAVAAAQVRELNIALDEESLDQLAWATTGTRWGDIHAAANAATDDHTQTVAMAALSYLERGETMPLSLVADLRTTGTITVNSENAFKNPTLTSIQRIHSLGKVRQGEVQQARML